MSAKASSSNSNIYNNEKNSRAKDRRAFPAHSSKIVKRILFGYVVNMFSLSVSTARISYEDVNHERLIPGKVDVFVDFTY